MEGPTPVSALIHAATMVAAGVFLVARVYPLFSLGAIDGVTPSLTVVVWIGVITALISALIALAQADIKRILAYSTVSQLGFMMVSLGVGGVAAGIMHLLAHGFFKALLFLGSGSVIHGCHEEQDIRQMGGLRRLMPVTFLTYAIGMMALSGVPLFFSGAWTKEEILHATSQWSVSRVPHYLMLAGVVLTALYMTRQMIYVFFGERRAAARAGAREPARHDVPLDRARGLRDCFQCRAHAGLAVAARLFVGRAGRPSTSRVSFSRFFSSRSHWWRPGSGSASCFIAAPARSIRSSKRCRHFFASSKIGCGSMNSTTGRFIAVARFAARAFRFARSLFLGWPGARGRRARSACWPPNERIRRTRH